MENTEIAVAVAESAELPCAPTWVYHGTGKDKLKNIRREGLDAPSYWAGSYEAARAYADSFGKQGVVLACRIERYTFQANMLVAENLLESGEIAQADMPGETELAKSLHLFEGIVCRDVVTDFQEVAGPVPDEY